MRLTNDVSSARRKVLRSIASAGVLLGLSGAVSAETAASATAAAPGTAGKEGTPEDLFAAARLRSYKPRRSSSWDRTGGMAIQSAWNRERRQSCWKWGAQAW